MAPLIHFIINQQAGSLELRVETRAGLRAIGPVAFSLNPAQRNQVKIIMKDIARGVRYWKKLHRPAGTAGNILFSALMDNVQVQGLYRIALAEARSHSSALNLWLTFDQQDLSELPWELLYDPVERLFLSAADDIAIARMPGDEQTSYFENWRPPLRLLVVLPTPSLAAWPKLRGRIEPPSLDTLSAARIFERLKQQEGEELIDYRLLAGREATPEALLSKLSGEYDVLYFMGHSETKSEGTSLLLEDGTSIRRGAWLRVSELSQKLQKQDSQGIQTSGVRAVVFSSCNSFAGAASLSNLAQLEAVVGMKMEMPMITSMAFDEAVVGAMAAWQPIDRCVLKGRQQAREVLRGRTFDDGHWDVTHRPDWAIPVLFTRAIGQRPGFCPIPAGNYNAGLDEAQLAALGEQFGFSRGLPRTVIMGMGRPRTVPLDAYRIGRWPVTNHQYRYYLEHSSLDIPLPPSFERSDSSVRLAGLNPGAPVVNVTWSEAAAFCRWVGGRLPTADEWEVAARGSEARIFPWGNKFDPGKCSVVNQPGRGPESVFLREGGASPFGVEDLCGNVFEWTDDRQGSSQRRKVMGGSWKSDPVLTIPSLRSLRDPDVRYSDVGFRCVISS